MKTKIDIGGPRFSGGQISDMVPVPMLRPGLENSPAKNLQTIKLAIPREKPAPSVNAAKIGREDMYTIFLPYCSLVGEAMIGPNESPSR